jgi:hypothetical protein
MPFKSKKQAAFMFANHPRIAARFVKESGKKHPVNAGQVWNDTGTLKVSAG